jgi:hypothetical protein
MRQGSSLDPPVDMPGIRALSESSVCGACDASNKVHASGVYNRVRLPDGSPTTSMTRKRLSAGARTFSDTREDADMCAFGRCRMPGGDHAFLYPAPCPGTSPCSDTLG